MANYQYDEGGGMAAYFLLTFLSIILIPFTLTAFSSSKKAEPFGCECSMCVKQHERIRQRNKRSLLNPKLGAKTLFLLGGWSLFAFLTYKVSTSHNESKVYDPFEILGIRSGVSEKEIKSHYKKLSRKFHPDKVKLVANQTMEMVEAYFVEITKAYKSLTDETVRRNLEQYGHPDGRQEISMGIAIPKWVVEGQHRFFFLVGYCIILGGLLPVIVGKWWFGNRIKTKDGIFAKSAETFFKSIKEDSSIKDLLAYFGQALENEYPVISTPLGDLEEKVRLGGGYTGSPVQTLLYAHLLRIPVNNPSLQKVQDDILIRSPSLLTSLLNIAMSHNWLTPTVNAMRLHAYVTQAVSPLAESQETSIFTQFNISEDDLKNIVGQLDERDVKGFIDHLQKMHDARAEEAKKAAESWGKLELVEASFKVIGERIVTPLSIVQLVVKARISPPVGSSAKTEQKEEFDVDAIKRSIKENDGKDLTFLSSKRDSEDLTNGLSIARRAHTPFWPAPRKPSWWVLVTEPKMNRVVMPPMRITDLPLSDPTKDRNFRAYKLQFQAPPNVAVYSWKIHLVSDTFVGEEVVQDVVLKVDDISQLSSDERGVEDEISEPEEDSLAGQMALMKGGNVKRSLVHDDSDDESVTDIEDSSSDDSSSDSD